MNAHEEYLRHISSLRSRMQSKSVLSSNMLPKDLFLRIKFGSYRYINENVIELIDSPAKNH